MVEPVVEPVIEPVSEPVIEPVSKPVSEPVSEPEHDHEHDREIAEATLAGNPLSGAVQTLKLLMAQSDGGLGVSTEEALDRTAETGTVHSDDESVLVAAVYATASTACCPALGVCCKLASPSPARPAGGRRSDIRTHQACRGQRGPEVSPTTTPP